ncbi:hypothetical protein ACFWAR_38950 [Streptomyces sp. NPDC059917]|uniref:hypothetical protein n=1 Tax=Streptomyces sp. NPDC059917 TaxID=3347002 RepID=UPI0036481375
MSCDFRPENRGALAPGQLADLVAECVEQEGHLVCHETGDAAGVPGAVCAGFAALPAAGRSLTLRIAAAGQVAYQDPAPAPGLGSR